MTQEEKKKYSYIIAKEKLTIAKVESAIKLDCPIQIVENTNPTWLVYKMGNYWEMKMIMSSMCYDVIIYRKDVEGLSAEGLVAWSVAVQALQEELLEARMEMEKEIEDNLYDMTSRFCEKHKCYIQQ